jgi:hypothetical protein
MTEPRECRCCRKPVEEGMLACKEHWAMLPSSIRTAVLNSYRGRQWQDYGLNVAAADAFWQIKGEWKQGEPK